MARATFGGTAADYVVTTGADGLLRLSSATLTMWTAATGGTQITDLLLGGSPVTSVPVGADGSVPTFQGPDGVTELWADAGHGRVRLTAPVTVVDSAVAALASNPASALGGALSAGYAPKWKANTSYAAGATVIAPDGSLVNAKSTFTSGATYNSANWTSVAVASGTQARSELDARYAPFLFSPRSPAFTGARGTNRTLITAFQSGHGWTVNSGAPSSSNLNDTSDFAFGSQAVKFVATPTSGSFNFKSPTLGTAIDMTKKNVRVLIKVEGVAYLTDLRIQPADSTIANGRNIKLPYNAADATKSYIKEGEWQWVSVCPADGSAIGTGSYTAVTAFQFRLQQPAGGNVTVHLGAIVVEDTPTAVTSGILCFTFDDSFVEQYTIAKPMLDGKGWAATAFPIAEKVDTTANFLTTAQCWNLATYSGWEFGVHSLTTAGHDAGFTALTDPQLQTELVGGRDALHTKGLGNGEGFAWPLGQSSLAQEITAGKIQSYARANTPEGFETLPVGNLMRIRSIPISAATTTAIITGYIDQAVTANKLLCLTIHQPVATGATGNQVNQSVLQAIADYAAGTAIKVMTLSDALKVR